MTLDKNPINFYDKELLSFSEDYIIEGIIGCYLFKNIQILKKYKNESGNMNNIFVDMLHDNKNIICKTIKYAEFFGTPEQLISFRYNRAKKYTFFVDIDGKLLYLKKYVSYDSSDSIVLPESIDKLNFWKSQGHTIILTTGRETSKRDLLIKQLKELNIPYDQLITGLHSGTRILINDKKPYCEFHKMAIAIQIKKTIK